MNWLQRLVLRLAARINPKLRALMKSSGGTLDRLETELYLHRERHSAEHSLVIERIQELRAAQAMSGSGPLLESVGAKQGAFREAIAELELALEDRGWKREQALAATEFSRYGIQQIMLICRLYKIKNPLVRRAIEVSALYVFGRGFEISSDDEATNEVLQACFSDPRNAVALSHTALVGHNESTWTDGNLFFVAFTDEKDGAVLWRTIDPTEIEEIICDPDDHAIPQLYHRRWIAGVFNPSTGVTESVPMEAWYPALGWEPTFTEVKGKRIEKTPVIHAKVGGLPKWHFGCPLAYPLIDWARAVRRFLENWATITDALANFSWQVETQGGAPAIAALKQTFATTLANDGTQIETNPTPTSGSAWISGPGNKITPMNTANKTTGPEECRRLVLMICAGAGLPETFFGDASTGSLATAQSLDRPTELKFLQAQEWWREVLQKMAGYVIERSAMAPKGKLREAHKGKTTDASATVRVDFPSVLEHDIAQMVAAIAEAMVPGGDPSIGIDEKTGITLLLQQLGVEDVQAVVDAMYPPTEYEPLLSRIPVMQADRKAALEPPPVPIPGAIPPNPKKPAVKGATAKESQDISRAVYELKKASEALKAKRSAA